MSWRPPNLDDFVPNDRRVSDDELGNYLLDHRYSDDLTIPADEEILSYNGVPIGNRGNIVAINGRAKSRKSVIASAMMSALISKKGFLGFENVGKRARKILAIDTEQGLGHYIKGVRRIFRDADLVRKPEDFNSYHCRDADVDFRISFIEYVIGIHKPDVLVIDGITDLVFDINDQSEATTIGQKLMTWSVKFDMLIIVVIHVTKGNGNMTGALGTYLEKKCQTAITCVKEDENDEVTDVVCQYSRDQGFKTWSIQFDNKAGHYVKSDETGTMQRGPKGDYSPHAMPPDAPAQILGLMFIGDRTFKGPAAFKEAIRKAGYTMTRVSWNAKHLSSWIHYLTTETMLVGTNTEGAYMRADSMVRLTRAAPELPLYQRELPPEAETIRYDGDMDDLPF